MNKLLYLLVISLILSTGTNSFGKSQKLEDQKVYHDFIGNYDNTETQSKVDKDILRIDAEKVNKSSELNSVKSVNPIPGTWIEGNSLVNLDRSFGNPVLNDLHLSYNPTIGENGLYYFGMLFADADEGSQFFDIYRIFEFESFDGSNWNKTQLDSHLTNSENFLAGFSVVPFRSAVATGANAYEKLFYISTFLGGNSTGSGIDGVSERYYTYSGPETVFPLITKRGNVETNNSGDPQFFTSGDMAITENENNSGGHMVDLLTPDGDNVQYGYYGYIGISGINFHGNIVPPEWFWDKFYHGEGAGTNSSAMTTPAIEADEFGNLYVASEVRNISDFQIQELFIPTVWKSTDNGASWADTTKCPESLINEWAVTKEIDGEMATSWTPRLRFAGNGVDATGNSNPRNPFVVTGEDQYSFFRYIVPTREDEEGGTIGEGHYIVEFKYDNGVWSINEVAALNDEVGPFANRTFFTKSEEVEERFGIADPEWGLFLRFNPRIIELEAARDASGDNIIVKYVDYRREDEESSDGHMSSLYSLGQEYTYYQYTVDNQQRADTIPATIDSIRVNDIYIAYRSVDDNDWTSYNQTNDDKSYISTRLPKIVESVENVSVFYPVTITQAEMDERYTNTFWDGLKTTPPLIRDFLYFTFGVKQLGFGTYNATEPTISSVKNQEKLSFDIKSVNPNPARDKFEVIYSTEKPEMVVIKLYNMQGTVIATLFEGMVPQGMHALDSFDASALGTGQYYVNMTVGSQAVTKIVNIIK